MEALFLYIWLEFVPAWSPCADYYAGKSVGCYLVQARDAYTKTNIERFESLDEAFAWVRKHGHEGQLWNLNTDEREQINVKPITQKIHKMIEIEEAVGYDIARFWSDKITTRSDGNTLWVTFGNRLDVVNDPVKSK